MTQLCIIPLARLLQPLVYLRYSNSDNTVVFRDVCKRRWLQGLKKHTLQQWFNIDKNITGQQKEDHLAPHLPI